MPLQGDVYAPYEPSSVSLESTDPPVEPSSGTVGSHPETGVEPEGPPKFDPRYQEAFRGLLFLGALTKSFDWLGHKFVIRTLTTDEILSAGLLTKGYEGSIAINKAYTTIMVAACIVSVDGDELPVPYMEEPGPSYLLGRFNYIKAKWYPFTVDYVYSQFLELEDTVQKVFDAMGKASG